MINSVGLGETLLKLIERRQRMDIWMTYGGMVGVLIYTVVWGRRMGQSVRLNISHGLMSSGFGSAADCLTAVVGVVKMNRRMERTPGT